MVAETKQMPIPRYDGFSGAGDGGRDDMVVIEINGHAAPHQRRDDNVRIEDKPHGYFCGFGF